MITALTLAISQFSFGQVSGNINYQNSEKVSENIYFPSESNIKISVKGLANVKADTYVAVFSVTQTGKTAEEVNRLINERIFQAVNQIKTLKEVETYVDMISFVPIYEYEIEKKIFSKKNYNEVPKGFELKKNIHIKYNTYNQLDEFINILSKEEIYDLVKVDYFANNLDNIKKELTNKAKQMLQDKIKSYETIMGKSLGNIEKCMVEGHKVMYPAQRYDSYQAFNSSSLKLNKSGNINQADKATTLYYQSITDKDFDFVINPLVFEPIIQIVYQVRLTADCQNTSKYMLITPNGEIKNLSLDK